MQMEWQFNTRDWHCTRKKSSPTALRLLSVGQQRIIVSIVPMLEMLANESAMLLLRIRIYEFSRHRGFNATCLPIKVIPLSTQAQHCPLLLIHSTYKSTDDMVARGCIISATIIELSFLSATFTASWSPTNTIGSLQGPYVHGPGMWACSQVTSCRLSLAYQ